MCTVMDTARDVFTVMDTARDVVTVMDTARDVVPVMDTARDVVPVMDTAREVFTVMDTAREVSLPAVKLNLRLHLPPLPPFSGFSVPQKQPVDADLCSGDRTAQRELALRGLSATQRRELR